jgi:hypothetical protein
VNAARRELYVYYHVARTQWRAAMAAAQRLQRALCSEHAGLNARVLRRADESSADAVTLMEAYTFDAVPGGIDTALEAHIAAAATSLDAWRIGERHVERFESLD